MNVSSRLLFAALMIALALPPSVACGGQKAPAAEDFPALGQPARVKVLASGDGAKTALRFKLRAGDKSEVSMTMDMKSEVRAAGQNMPMNMVMKMSMGSEITELRGDDAVVTATIRDASFEMPGLGLGGSEADAIRDMVRGLTITFTMSTRGEIRDSKVQSDDAMVGQLMGQLGDSMDQMAIPFPEEPVAVGARWQALTTQEMNGIKSRLAATYELLSIDGNVGRVKVTIQQFADPQTMDLQGIPAELRRLRSEGSGEMTFDLDKPLGVRGELRMKMDTDMTVMGSDASMKMDARISMTSGD